MSLNSSNSNPRWSQVCRSLVLFLSCWFCTTMPSLAEPISPFANPGPAVQRQKSVEHQYHHLLQDHAGFIWIGTNKGLIRFDGYENKTFVHNSNDSNSLSNDFITAMVEGEQGVLWIATYGGGLNRFDSSTFEFTHFKHDTNNPASISTDRLFDIAKSADNKLWVGGFWGLNLFDPQSGFSQRKNAAFGPLEAGNSQRVMTLFEDSQQRLWYTVAGEGLYVYNPDLAIDKKHQPIKHFEHNGKDSTSIDANVINRVYETRKGDIWVATSNGMNRFNAANNAFDRFALPLKAQNHIKALNIRTIFEDDQQRLWVGTLYNGLSLFDAKRQAFDEVNNNADSSTALTSMSVASMMQDTSGALWLGTLTQGLLKISSEAFLFNTLTASKQSTLTIGALFKDAQGNIWIGANNNLYQLNEQTLQVTLRARVEGHINAIVEAPDKTLRLSIFKQGIFKFDPAGNQTKLLLPLPPLPNNNLHTMAIDKQGTLWISVYKSGKQKASGLFSLARGDSQYVHHLNTGTVSSILPLGNHQLLLGFRHNGLKLFDPSSKKLTNITHQDKPLRNVWRLFKDSSNTIWVGTQTLGLGQFDPNTLDIQFIDQNDGLPSNTIYVITQDNQKNLWLGTPAGLTQLSLGDKATRVFGASDGLPGGLFTPGHMINTAKGGVLVVNEHQLLQFSPQMLTRSKPVSRPFDVLLTNLKVLNKPVQPNHSNDQSKLSATLNQTRHLTLDYQDYLFSVSFASTQYNRAGKLRYAYKLEGLDEQWIEKDYDEPIATFTALAPKTYEFKVKTSDTQGNWPKHYRSLKITITPPWWKTRLAYTLYVFIALSTIYALYRWQTLKLVNRAQKLEQGIKARTATINTLLEHKERLFANVSHEFRTPLTLILTPLDKMLSHPKSQHLRTDLTLVKRSGQRLLKLVDQLLELAKLEHHQKSQFEPVSLGQTLNIIMASFEPLMRSKQMTLSINEFDDMTLKLLPDSLNKILINLLSNAYKYTPTNGQISVTVTALGQAQNVEIAVKDSGIGISEKDSETIFDRFSRVTTHQGEFTPGAGIGLALVKELVTKNKGAISFISQLNQGSTFTVTLPLAAEHIRTDLVSSMQPSIHQQMALVIEETTPQFDFDTTIGEPVTKQTGLQKSLLIIDDNADMRTLLQTNLSGEYQCMTASNGQEGLNIAREQLPDLIISDIMMPLMDGYEMAQLLKSDELTSHIPIILLTAKGSLESRLKGLQLLVDDYIAKPFNFAELNLRIHNILSIRDILSKRHGHAIESVKTAQKMAVTEAAEMAQQFLDKINEQMHNHYANPDLSALIFSASLKLSEKQLQRKLKACFDLTFPEFVRNYRLTQAVGLLATGQKVSQIYYAVGFSSHAYFSRCFKAKFGTPPTQYQQEVIVE
jgi:signal transduction histidine kinase/ligand-binding sensor domain-containing protein/DNA-binding response OmpR family regulator